MIASADDLVVVGKITTIYGVKGWVKLLSYTEPMENLLDYRSWFLRRNGNWEPIEFVEARPHQKGLVARIKGVDDREQARAYCQCDIAVPTQQMPELEEGDFYWHQLEGLKVFTTDETGQQKLLGVVDHMLETGANDVMVVQGCVGSIDQRERLIPWLPEQVVTGVDLEAGCIQVDWDSDF